MSKRRAAGEFRLGLCLLLALCASQGVQAQSPPEVPRLIADLKSEVPEVRNAAIDGLAKIGPPAIPALIAAVKDAENAVRASASHALGRIGPGAKDAVPALAAAFRDGPDDVRASAAHALAEIGLAAVPELIALLKDSTDGVRSSAADALGVIGPAAADAVPALIAALKDSNYGVRSSAAGALGKIGPAAADAVPAINAALKEGLLGMSESAAGALGGIGPAAADAVPALIAALKEGNYFVEWSAAEALGKIGTAAVPALIAALKDGNPRVRMWAAHALGKIGPAAADAVPALIAALKDSTDGVRSSAADALGVIGPAAADAVPALIAALKDLHPHVLRSAGEALGRLATGISSKNEVNVAVRRNLQDALTALRSPDDPADLAILKDSTERVATAVAYLSALEQTSLGLRISRWLATFSLKDWRTWVLICGATWFALVGILYAIFMARPIWLLSGRERVEKSITLRLNPETKWSILKGEIPLGDAISSLTLLRFFATRRRTLDAWVREHVGACRDNFERVPTVEDRKVFVPLTVKYEDRTILGPDFSAREMRSCFGEKGRSARLLIVGEGGAGKTSLACQLGRWGMAEEKADRLAPWLMLPVLVEEELDDKVIPKGLPRFTAKVRSKLQQLAGLPEPPSEDLLGRLLREKRVLLIVDHFSEMGEETQKQISFDDAGLPAAALIVTSRREDTLGSLPKHVLRPPRIEGKQVASFLETYLQERGKRGIFEDDEDFFEACRRLSRMVGEREITVLLAKLYADQIIASKGALSENSGSKPPESIPELMLGYLNELNRASAEGDPDNLTLHRDAKAIAWECLKQTYKPAPAELRDVVKAMRQGEVADFEAESRLSYYDKNLRLVKVAGAAKGNVEFALHPLAEYLAAMKVVERNRGTQRDWDRFVAKAEQMPDAPESIKGFLLAVRDCCLATADSHVPESVIEELGKRGGLDPEYMGRMHRKRRVKKFAEELRSEVAADRRHAVAMLRELGPEAAGAVPALAAALNEDGDTNVRRCAADALGEIGPAAVDVVPALAAALKDRDEAVRGSAIAALTRIGPAAVDAVPALAAALKDRDEAVRRSAIVALTRIGPAAVPALAVAFNDGDTNIRWSAAAAMARIGPAAVPALIAALNRDGDTNVRRWAANTLGEIGPAAVDAVPALAAALKDGDANVRWSAAAAMARIGPAAVPALTAALKDGDRHVRSKAADVLGEIGPAAVPALIAGHKNDDSRVRQTADYTLSKIDPAASVASVLDGVPEVDETRSKSEPNPAKD